MRNIQVIILFLFVMGCSSKQAIPSTTASQASPSPSVTETAIPSTQTLTPTSTSVPTVTSAPTWTPFPTLSLTDGTRILRIWVMGTLDCLLPCWGGVTPGKTKWQEAKQLLMPISGLATLNVSENSNCDFGPCNKISWSLSPNTLAEGNYYSKSPEDVVHLISIDIQNAGAQKTNYTREIKLRDIFKFYGFPTILLLDADLGTAKDRFLNITMVYPKRQFIIIYSKKAKIDGDKATSCGQYSRVRIISLDNKDQLASLDAISNAAETKDLNLNIQHKSSEEAIGMTNSAFYEYFSGKREPCISTPVAIWNQ